MSAQTKKGEVIWIRYGTDEPNDSSMKYFLVSYMLFGEPVTTIAEFDFTTKRFMLPCLYNCIPVLIDDIIAWAYLPKFPIKK